MLEFVTALFVMSVMMTSPMDAIRCNVGTFLKVKYQECRKCTQTYLPISRISLNYFLHSVPFRSLAHSRGGTDTQNFGYQTRSEIIILQKNQINKINVYAKFLLNLCINHLNFTLIYKEKQIFP